MAIQSIGPVANTEAIHREAAELPPHANPQAEPKQAPVSNTAVPVETPPLLAKAAQLALQTSAPPSLQFHMDEETGKTVIKMIDPQSGRVLRQIPSVEALDLAKALGHLQGALVDLKV